MDVPTNMSTAEAVGRRGDYGGRRVTVMGLGRFGGGLGAVRFLARHGARVTLTDLKPAAELAESLAELGAARIEELRLGEHRQEDFTRAELVVASPAIRPDHPCLVAARKAGVPVTTEVGLFWKHCPGRIIGVTGSAGKSTTSALLHHLLTASGGRAWLGGNLGGSLLDQVDAMQQGDWVVLELSSFQLSYVSREGRSPEIAVVTNFAPNHLDWHTSLEEYRAAKQALLAHQRAGDTAVLNADDPDVCSWPSIGRVVLFGRGAAGPGAVQVVPPALQFTTGDVRHRLSLDLPTFPPGLHNLSNAAAAVAAALAAGADPTTFVDACSTFRGLPHRLEFLQEVRGVRFYDDSKATTPEAACMALRSFDRPVILLAGGSDKGSDLTPFAAEIARRAKGVALMGATAEPLARLLASSPLRPPPHRICLDFAEAFAWSVAQAVPGDIILLSPGCASFGWFRDYADRGAQFQQAVERWRTC